MTMADFTSPLIPLLLLVIFALFAVAFAILLKWVAEDVANHNERIRSLEGGHPLDR